jgi:hypothetical protein
VPHISESEAEEEDQDVKLNVVYIGAFDKKSVGKKKIPQGVPYVPIDNISFHSLENVARWKYVMSRRLALKRELSKEALQRKDVVKLIEHAGLMKIMSRKSTRKSLLEVKRLLSLLQSSTITWAGVKNLVLRWKLLIIPSATSSLKAKSKNDLRKESCQQVSSLLYKIAAIN